MFDTITGIASLLGLAISVFSFFQAKGAKKIASEARDVVRSNRQTSDISKLIGHLDIVIQEIKIFGPATAAEKMMGIEHHKIAVRVQDFTLSLKGVLGQFANTERKRASMLCEDTDKLLAGFVDDTKSSKEKMELGRKLLNELTNFSSIMKANLNKRIDKG